MDMHRQAEKWYLTRQTFPELLHRNCLRFPDRPAQLWRDEKGGIARLSYGGLGDVVREIAGGLLSMGVEKGDRVAIAAPTVPQWMWADYAILCTGAITVAIHPSLGAYDMGEQIRDSGSRIVFVCGKAALKSILASGTHTLKAIVWMGSQNLDLPDHPCLCSLEALREDGRRFFNSSPLLYGQRWRGVQPDDPMTLIYTSGTTGQPKGVLHTHGSVTSACIRDLCAVPLLEERDCLLSFLPLSHSFERQCGHGTAMFAAIPIAYGSAQTLGEDLRLFQPTYLMGVPSTYAQIYARVRATLKGSWQHFLFRMAEKKGLWLLDRVMDSQGRVDVREGRAWTQGAGWRHRFSYGLVDFFVFRKLRKRLGGRLRFVFSAAGVLPEKLCRLYLCAGIRILEGYGATETCNTVALNPVEAVRPGSVGVFSKGVEYRIAEDGELLVKGPFLFKEYWGRPEETRRVFTPDGFYCTGDVVELLDGGYLRVVDRKKGLLMLNTGQRVASAKLESLFTLSPYIERVVPVGDDRPFAMVLVQPNFRAFIRIFQKHGVPFDTHAVKETADGGLTVYPDFVRIPELVTMVEIEIAAVNEKLQNFEKIRNFVLLHEPLSIERGELTPTLKARRDVVIARYRDSIEKAYAKGPRC
jgi:long-chain acyl-CoA synthetase